MVLNPCPESWEWVGNSILIPPWRQAREAGLRVTRDITNCGPNDTAPPNRVNTSLQLKMVRWVTGSGDSHWSVTHVRALWLAELRGEMWPAPSPGRRWPPWIWSSSSCPWTPRGGSSGCRASAAATARRSSLRIRVFMFFGSERKYNFFSKITVGDRGNWHKQFYFSTSLDWWKIFYPSSGPAWL